MKIKILIADDDMLIRESLKIIIGMDENFEIVNCAENGFEAVKYCKANKVDVALLDVRMPVLNGVEAVREITEATDTKCLVLTTFDEDDYIRDAIHYGAKGYLLKNNTPDKIKDAIKVVYGGNVIMQDVILDRVKNNIDIGKSKIDESIFSSRELDIIKLIAKGYSNKDISAELFISEGTIKNYITTILNKTELEHRTQIAVYYLTGNK